MANTRNISAIIEHIDRVGNGGITDEATARKVLDSLNCFIATEGNLDPQGNMFYVQLPATLLERLDDSDGELDIEVGLDAGYLAQFRDEDLY